MFKITKDKHIYLIFGLLCLIQILLISPFGEFALNDDWTHTWVIYNYFQSGNFIYPEWLSSNMHIPILYGVSLSKIFIFYKLLRSFGTQIKLSFILTLLLWFNPIFFNLSYTFMGDIPALFFLLLAIYVSFLGFKKENNRFIFLGSILAVLGFFIRQTNILLLPAIGLGYILKKRKVNLKNITYLFVLPFIILLVVYLFLQQYNLVPGEVGARFLPNDWSYFKHISINLWHFLLLFSLFILPVTLALFFKNLSLFKNIRFYSFIILFFILGIIAFYSHNLFPGLGNIISMYGLGPSNLVMQGSLEVWGAEIVYVILNIILILNLPILFFILFRDKKIFKNKDINFVYIFFIVYFLLLLPIFSFDRYLLMLLPILFLYLAKILQKYNYSKFIIILITLVFAAYSIIGTNNYLAWNKVRWEIGQKLLVQGVEASNIEGGYEWNGLYLYGHTEKLGDFTPLWAPWYVKKLTPGHQMDYIISFSPLGGYTIIDQQKVNGILSNIKYIYLNKVAPKSLK